MLLIELVYGLALLGLAVYGANSFALLALYILTRGRHLPRPPSPTAWPTVTVQLPIYNELHVVERLIAAVAGLDYPRHCLQIQVLDDSTDATRVIAREATERCRARGLDAMYIRRRERAGYKGGALAEGMKSARGELIAVFDADFIPSPDFLRRVVPYFAEPRLGCVQTRWEHLNLDYSAFTQAQALGIDGHFLIEQEARNRAGLFMNFNGTAGVWRAACIREAGGWQGDSLTEDLDLSYRAQLAGWRFLFLPEVVVPGELPAQMDALKRQQFRWAKGSLQTAKKLLGPLWRSKFSAWIKIEGTIHLTAYMAHPLMLLVLLLAGPMSFSGSPLLDFLPVLLLTALGPPLLYWVAQRQRKTNLAQRLVTLFHLVLLGTGLSLSNTRAAWEALWGIEGTFRRTPKFDLRDRHDRWEQSGYALSHDRLAWVELGLGIYALALFTASLFVNHVPATPWLMVYALGYGYVAGMSLWQSLGRRRVVPRLVVSEQ